MPRYGVILLLEPAVADASIAYSAALAAAHPTFMALGPDAPPHITLLHAACEPAQAAEWWSAAQRAGDTFDVERAGLVLEEVPVGNEYSPDGGVTCGVNIIRSAALNHAHEIVLAAAREAGTRPMGAAGDRFRPHITLNFFRSFPTGPIPFAAPAVSGPATARLAFGELGPFGTFPRIISSR
ncbi:2'-5' RNA ligase family protein [Actinoplanes rectilineatus]|uniref:2'-5' RNA ligase family protein n=1 Tax=Actinoplanes rectilineatus TaxID=113571 RepID=UPI0005F2F177|nr:2'-5' RNA ligase family protein [Actinoplanes rectilineatus]